ncbi:DUF992 domain-containing protein [Aestuariivirga sp.]|jgi:hypothetical protein|uniref:DUF992 domain-containing protein n=1 Tax=Aestuariivirga sp. TaxID=2650926 RepID=UPI00378440DA
MKRLATLIAAVAVPAVLASPALADNGVKVGVLNCDISGSVGLIIAGSESASCVFEGPNGAENYKGRISKLGIDIGVTDASAMSWVVFAAGKLGKGELAGTYVGATAEATVAVGLGANVLVGGSGNSIALQPVSVEGQTGVSIAAGLAEFSLSYAP